IFSGPAAWSAVELQTFLAILGDGVIQGELEGSIRNEKVFKEVSQRLAAHGFERTSDQCRVKVKKLKMQYRKIKDESNRSGNSGSTWKWFDAMDAIYGRRGREGGLGSAAALLESLVEPVGKDFSTINDLHLG
uniref:Myb/SANT-like DNA-binding domain-containing protein n=1 Tax=Oryzias melastigma TaxID=30732 RepID=A0A3B3CM57_ORYME